MFFSTSPYLLHKGKPAELRECPVGAVLRESPHVYDVIGAYGTGEHIGPSILQEPLWLQHAFRVVGSERNRLMDLERTNDKAKHDAAYGARVRRRGHG